MKKKSISICQDCGGIKIDGECFHKRNCPLNNLSEEEWLKEDRRRNQNLVNFFSKEIELLDKVNLMSYKEMADLLINKVWVNQKWGTIEEVVLNRVIDILFKLNDEEIIIIPKLEEN